MLTIIPFNVEHLSCCLLVLFVFHSYDSRQKLPVSNCTPQKSKIKQWMLTHGQDKGLSSESCMLYILSPGLDCDHHTEGRVLMYIVVPSLWRTFSAPAHCGFVLTEKPYFNTTWMLSDAGNLWMRICVKQTNSCELAAKVLSWKKTKKKTSFQNLLFCFILRNWISLAFWYKLHNIALIPDNWIWSGVAFIRQWKGGTRVTKRTDSGVSGEASTAV